ncbi:hypothetical protein [Psychrobacter sp. I-STPA6b]|nr:hypothetical protein [Psychrobacter sp. I-STPA6b]
MQNTIQTSAKVSWGNKKVPVKIVFGAKKEEVYGSLFGIGV